MNIGPLVLTNAANGRLGQGHEARAASPIARSSADIHIVVTGGTGVKMTCLAPWGGGTMCVTRRLQDL